MNRSMKTISKDFRFSALRLIRIIEQLNLHNGIGWVDLYPLLVKLRVHLKYVYAPDHDLHGLAIADSGAGWNSMYINSADPLVRQRESIGHESFHFIEFQRGVSHLPWSIGFSKHDEYNCKCAAAILYVPLSDLIEMVRSDFKTEQIAGELRVPVELVEIRWQIAVQVEGFDNLGF